MLRNWQAQVGARARLTTPTQVHPEPTAAGRKEVRRALLPAHRLRHALHGLLRPRLRSPHPRPLRSPFQRPRWPFNQPGKCPPQVRALPAALDKNHCSRMGKESHCRHGPDPEVAWVAPACSQHCLSSSASAGHPGGKTESRGRDPQLSFLWVWIRPSRGGSQGQGPP